MSRGVRSRPVRVSPNTGVEDVVPRFARDFACLPVGDPGASLLTTGTPRIVDTVIVDAEVVVSDGRSTRIDTAALTDGLAGTEFVG